MKAARQCYNPDRGHPENSRRTFTRFDKWLRKLRQMTRNQPKPIARFYSGSMTKTNGEAWKTYFDGRYSPEDALNEDLNYLM